MSKGLRVDYKQVCAAFNSRAQEDHKVHDLPEMKKICRSLGIREDVFQLMLKKGTYFRVRKQGLKKELVFQTTPIHFSVFKALFNEALAIKNKVQKNKEFDEQEVISFLKSRGYRILKEDGIDEDTLKKEHPDIYEKYMVVKEV